MISRLRWRTGGLRTLALTVEKEDVMKPFNRIMVATDFTEASAPAFQEAIELAKKNGSELLISHAYQPPNMVQADAVRRASTRSGIGTSGPRSRRSCRVSWTTRRRRAFWPSLSF